ncbi:SET domain-containing protein 4 [Chytriomyces hyalinus]|nr:SET domain-containing protein 4 [Chytriomyces hyalinus]
MKAVREEEDPDWAQFRQWMQKEKCGHKAGLTLANSTQTGRGLMATRGMVNGDLVVRIDSRFLVTSHKAAAFLKLDKDPRIRLLSEHAILALFMAMQRHKKARKKGGFWNAYLDMTPKSFDTVAANYPPDLFQLLPEQVRRIAKRQLETFEKDYAQASLIRSVDKEDYRWGWYAVNTRCITLNTAVPSNAKQKQALDGAPKIALAPFLDLLNHSTTARIHANFNPVTDAFEITTLAEVERGKECFISYGSHDNAFLLAEYGFTVQESGKAGDSENEEWVHNSFDHVDLDRQVLGMEIPGEKKGFRELALKELGDAAMLGDYGLELHQDSYRVMNALRLYACSQSPDQNFKSQLQLWRKVLQGQLEVVSAENEKIARFFLKTICEQALRETIASMDAVRRWKMKEGVSQLNDIRVLFALNVYESHQNILKWHIRCIT